MLLRRPAMMILVTLIACTQSNVDPNAQIQITGSLKRQSGVPVADTSLSMGKGPDAIDVVSTVTTLGLACLTEELPNACDDRRITTTAPDGTFRYDLKGSDTQGFFGNASTLEISSHLPRQDEQLDGPSVTMRFQVQTERLDLPMRFWEPAVSVSGDGRQLSATWSRVPATILPPAGSLDRIRSSLRFTRGAERVWSFRLGARGGRFDPRYLEDSQGSVAVVSEERGLSVGASFGSRIDMVWRSARFPYVSSVGAPVSRGARCSVTSAAKKLVAQSNCRITDGDFSNAFEPHTCAPDSTCTEPSHRRVILDLGKLRPVTLVVIRGCSGRCAVEVSSNTRAWKMIGSGADGQEFVGLTPAAGASERARYVRVRSDADLSRLAEVSVWDRSRGAPATRPSGSSILTTLREASQQPLSTGPGRGFSIWKFLVVALVAFGLVGAFMLGRARRPTPPAEP